MKIMQQYNQIKELNMNKAHTVQSIINIIKDHNLKMRIIQDALKGQKIYETIPKEPKLCIFTIWLKDGDNHFKEILGTLFFGNLKKLHTQWYSEYIKIYNIFFKEEEKGILSRLLHAPKANEMDIDRAKLYYLDLEKYSQELLHSLASSKRRLEALNETKFH